MSPLVNFPSRMYLSHTQPPFIYQYVGDQIKILKVLGNYPFNENYINKTDSDLDLRDQNKLIPNENSLNSTINEIKQYIADVSSSEKYNILNNDSIVPNIPVVSGPKDDKDENEMNANNLTSIENIVTYVNKKSVDNATKVINTILLNEHMETSSLDNSQCDYDSFESDDEASFGTPENSPKSKKKVSKGKYGKGKAPLPPAINADKTQLKAEESYNNSEVEPICHKLPYQESVVVSLSKPSEINEFESIQTNNPIMENKVRQTSKSPMPISKSTVSGLGKLLQLPSKLAFWHKNDDVSMSSNDCSRRSSAGEKIIDEFQSCVELNMLIEDNMIKSSDVIEDSIIEKPDTQISAGDIVSIDGEGISQDLIDKSDALQKLIEAKIECHPEYKFMPINDKIPIQSKSTDV